MDEVTADYIRRCREEMADDIEHKFKTHRLTDDQIDEIAEKAATKAVAKITDMAYREVGKGVVSKLFYIAGVLTVAAYLYAQSRGLIK